MTSRESIEASIILSGTSDSGECLSNISPLHKPSNTTGVSVTISQFSEEDDDSTTEKSHSEVDDYDESTTSIEEMIMAHNRSERPMKDAMTQIDERRSIENHKEKFNRDCPSLPIPDSTMTPPAENISEENLPNCTIAFDMHTTRRFPPASSLTVEEQNDRLREYVYELQLQLRRALTGDADRLRLITENIEYKMKLEEMNSYIDKIDLEAEQEFNTITDELEFYKADAEDKKKDLVLMESLLKARDEEIRKLEDSHDAMRMAHMKQKEIIENMSQELDSELERRSEMDTMRKQLRDDRDAYKKKELLFACELDEVQRELNKQKELLQAGSVGEVINAWEAKIEKLEDQLRERDAIIFTQQHLINELRRGPNPKMAQSNSSASGSLPRPLQ